MSVVSTILLDLVDFLLDLDEALCRGFLDDRRAVDIGEYHAAPNARRQGGVPANTREGER